MNKFKLILSLLTRIPVGKIDYSESEFEKSIKLTPLVGVIIGIILSLIALFLDKVENKLAVGFILTIVYIFITGGLHLDGLSDSFDGLFSGRDKVRMLEIMKDSRVGAFGAISLILIIIGYIIFLGDSKYIAIFIMPIVGRSSLYIASKNSTYGRSQGMGKTFVEKGGTKGFLVTFILINSLCVVISIVFNSYYIIISSLISYLLTFKIVKFVENKIDGITGDILGLIVELTQITFLVLAYILISV
ncbi:MAG: adenosylcobinamide-GDP ribazoletransferase [Sarcina sp.]